MRPISTAEIARRAAIWAATLRDDAGSLRARAEATGTASSVRQDLLRLARALNRAAKVLDLAAGQTTRRRAPKRRR
jgi:hypothetical protein